MTMLPVTRLTGYGMLAATLVAVPMLVANVSLFVLLCQPALSRAGTVDGLDFAWCFLDLAYCARPPEGLKYVGIG